MYYDALKARVKAANLRKRQEREARALLERLDVCQHLAPWPVDGFSFVRFRPGKPKWMHESTYQRHLIRLSRYQLRHGKRLAEDLARLFR